MMISSLSAWITRSYIPANLVVFHIIPVSSLLYDNIVISGSTSVVIIPVFTFFAYTVRLKSLANNSPVFLIVKLIGTFSPCVT